MLTELQVNCLKKPHEYANELHNQNMKGVLRNYNIPCIIPEKIMKICWVVTKELCGNGFFAIFRLKQNSLFICKWDILSLIVVLEKVVAYHLKYLPWKF